MVRWETPRICKRSARSTARSCAIWVSFPVGRPLRTAPIAWVVVGGVTACAICQLLSAKCPEKAICHPASPQAARTRSCKEMQEGTRLAEVRPDIITRIGLTALREKHAGGKCRMAARFEEHTDELQSR